MKDITDLTVNQIRIFPVDVVPINIIATKSCIQKIREDLSVNEIESRPPFEGTNAIIFQRGETKLGNKIIVINKVEVEHRRIILEVLGTSKQANQVYDLLLSSIAAAANIDLASLQQPLFLAETTRCIVTLDFNFEELFNSAFIGFLNDKVKNEATNQTAGCTVGLLAAIAEIRYQIKDDVLTKNQISLNPKQFAIAPRPGMPLEARRYVTSSPFNSDTHLKLIRSLNKLMTKTIEP